MHGPGKDLYKTSLSSYLFPIEQASISCPTSKQLLKQMSSTSDNSSTTVVAIPDAKLQAIVRQAMATAIATQVRPDTPVPTLTAVTSPGFEQSPSSQTVVKSLSLITLGTPLSLSPVTSTLLSPKPSTSLLPDLATAAARSKPLLSRP
jgi:hypothetical protein